MRAMAVVAVLVVTFAPALRADNTPVVLAAWADGPELVELPRFSGR